MFYTIASKLAHSGSLFSHPDFYLGILKLQWETLKFCIDYTLKVCVAFITVYLNSLKFICW